MYLSIPVRTITEATEDGYLMFPIDLKGCFAEEISYDESMLMLKGALTTLIEAYIVDKQEIPWEIDCNREEYGSYIEDVIMVRVKINSLEQIPNLPPKE